MKLLFVNTGTVRSLKLDTRRIRTAIFKTPTDEPVWASRLGLQGDEQADRKVHGGEDQAVYAFPFEHYSFYGELLRRDDFTPGQFGENLTIEGFLEDQVFIGDRLRIGEATFQVSQPRIPCSKLGLHLKDSRIVPAMTNTLRTGFYLRVLEEGLVKKGDTIEHWRAAGPSMTVSEIAALRMIDKKDLAGAAKAATLSALSSEWRIRFSRRS
jgi:MOSC domain-containing protein YiiM